MSYGIIKKILSRDRMFNKSVVLVESPFIETTRNGKYLDSVRLGLTPNQLVIIAHSKDQTCNHSIQEPSDLCTIYPLKSVELNIFKRTRRQSLKACFRRRSCTRYFDLGETEKRQIFWSLWCNHIIELRNGTVSWPFIGKSENKKGYKSCGSIAQQTNLYKSDIYTISDTIQYKRQQWTDKHLYFGTNREKEDMQRPIPVPGLGPTEEIKLLYLKPQYFGCWDQSEHWVQCPRSGTETVCDYDVYTYTGEPTSKVTYTSLMTTWK